RNGLAKTRSAMVARITTAISGDALDEEAADEIEEILIQADVGVDAAVEIVDRLRERLRRAESGAEQIFVSLRKELCQIAGGGVPFDPGAELTGKPHVVLVVGVNGVGKTTTIGKLARLYRDSGRSVLLAACDTFRAAAVPQLEIWAERAGANIVRAQQGADPAAVAFDAVSAALSRDTDVVLVDTAGRLHTKVNLMEELKKVRRSLGKQCQGAPHETLLVLDATTGQNALSQARQFHLATEVTGLVLTKLDGTAKGGIAFALRRELGIPIKLIGVGEGEDDLQPFDGETFVEALLER
ncbi:MAG: signal recognition particle-docking protein FtsY, partial [Candidatus Latescibacterota bacterium]|nr:signal recognition particle-docking protein FtsY [Candidatus Latescibacterota bacterium]